MPSPVLKRFSIAVCAALATSCTGHAGSRSLFEVGRATSNHTILVSSSAGPRLEIRMGPVRSGGGAATLVNNGRVWRVTETDCDAFRMSLQEWRGFPPIRLGPVGLQDGPTSVQIPPGSLDGYGDWTIRTQAAVPGNHPVDVTVHDPGGLYAIWAERTVRGIMRCPESR